jgi:hypothetical protein
MNETMNLETKMRKVLPVIHKLTRRYGYAAIRRSMTFARHSSSTRATTLRER